MRRIRAPVTVSSGLGGHTKIPGDTWRTIQIYKKLQKFTSATYLGEDKKKVSGAGNCW